MGRTNKLALSANQVVIKMDTKTVGVIQNSRGSEDYAPEKLSGVGDIRAQEHVPTAANYSVSVSFMALRLKSLWSVGLANVIPADALKGFVFDIEFQDKDTGKMLRRYVDCTFASGDIEVNKHAIIASNATFLALDVSGEMITA